MSINDKVFTKLGELGYVGSLPDRMLGKLKDDYGVSNINEGFYKAGGLKSFVSGLLDVSYVARLDGVSQYWQLSEPISLLLGYKVRYKTNVTGGLGNVVYLHGNSAQSTSLSAYIVPSNSQLSFSGSIDEKLDGNPFVNNSEVQLGVEYAVEFSVGSNKDIVTLFRLQDIEKYTAGYIYDLEVLDEAGAVVNKIPLTNKEQGGTQLATTGSVNAFMPNYTPDVWEVNP